MSFFVTTIIYAYPLHYFIGQKLELPELHEMNLLKFEYLRREVPLRQGLNMFNCILMHTCTFYSRRNYFEERQF